MPGLTRPNQRRETFWEENPSGTRTFWGGPDVTGLRRRLLQLAPLFVLLAGPALAQVPSSPTLQFPYTQPPAEGVGVRKMPAPNPHWVLINAPLYRNFIRYHAYVLDSRSRHILRM